MLQNIRETHHITNNKEDNHATTIKDNPPAHSQIEMRYTMLHIKRRPPRYKYKGKPPY